MKSYKLDMKVGYNIYLNFFFQTQTAKASFIQDMDNQSLDFWTVFASGGDDSFLSQ